MRLLGNAVCPRFSALQRAEIAEMVRRPECTCGSTPSFSALQRAEIAEIRRQGRHRLSGMGFSALQRAEIAEIVVLPAAFAYVTCFSALQRAEIAEMDRAGKRARSYLVRVSVLFNEPKLLK